MCTYFPKYTPLIGLDVRSEDYIKSQIENIADNYSRTEGYLQNNSNNMPQYAIDNMEDKQKNRLNQLNNLSEKNNFKVQ